MAIDMYKTKFKSWEKNFNKFNSEIKLSIDAYSNILFNAI